jgi:hypothetical protein
MQTMQCWVIGLMSIELAKTWKMLWPNFTYYPSICLKELIKTMTNLSEDSQCPSQNSHQPHTKYKPWAITLGPTCTILPFKCTWYMSCKCRKNRYNSQISHVLQNSVLQSKWLGMPRVWEWTTKRTHITHPQPAKINAEDTKGECVVCTIPINFNLWMYGRSNGRVSYAMWTNLLVP